MNITLILGHPDAGGRHFCRALGAAYVQGAKDSGHEVRTIDVAALQFDLLRNADEWQQAAPCGSIREAQESIAWARHLVVVFPLRVYYHAHSVRSLKRNILEFCGIAPVQTAYFGTVESPRARELALARVRALGRAGR